MENIRFRRCWDVRIIWFLNTLFCNCSLSWFSLLNFPQDSWFSISWTETQSPLSLACKGPSNLFVLRWKLGIFNESRLLRGHFSSYPCHKSERYILKKPQSGWQARVICVQIKAPELSLYDKFPSWRKSSCSKWLQLPYMENLITIETRDYTWSVFN